MTRCKNCGAIGPSVPLSKLTEYQRKLSDGASLVCPVCFKRKNNPDSQNSKYKMQVTLLFFCFFMILTMMVVIRFDEIKSSFFINVNELTPINGIIVSTDVVEEQTPSSLEMGYRTFIEYIYSVNGKEYISSTIGFREVWYDDEGVARLFLADYQVGESATVYTKKDEPYFSVIRPDICSKQNLIYSFLLLSLIFLAWFLLLYKENKDYGSGLVDNC